MGRALLGLIAGGGLGAVAGNAALMQLFGIDLATLLERMDQRTMIFLGVIAIPILFLMVRGWIGFLVTALLISAGAAFASKLYFEDELPWEQVLTMTTVYGLVAVAVYRLLVSRVLG